MDMRLLIIFRANSCILLVVFLWAFKGYSSDLDMFSIEKKLVEKVGGAAKEIVSSVLYSGDIVREIMPGDIAGMPDHKLVVVADFKNHISTTFIENSVKPLFSTPIKQGSKLDSSLAILSQEVSENKEMLAIGNDAVEMTFEFERDDSIDWEFFWTYTVGSDFIKDYLDGVGDLRLVRYSLSDIDSGRKIVVTYDRFKMLAFREEEFDIPVPSEQNLEEIRRLEGKPKRVNR